jgi:hypothetical protein
MKYIVLLGDGMADYPVKRLGGRTPLQVALSDIELIEAMGQTLWVVSPEDMILSKLEWMKGRESDVQYSDALGVAVTQRETLDFEYLRGLPELMGEENYQEALTLRTEIRYIQGQIEKRKS